MKYILLIACALLLFLSGMWYAQRNGLQEREQAIEWLEEAIDTHQRYIDLEIYNSTGSKEHHQKWIDRYEKIMEVLK